MMELHENIDEALLLLYFSGTLGEKEKEEVEIGFPSLKRTENKLNRICLHTPRNRYNRYREADRS